MHIFGNRGHVTSHANDGHIIIRPDEATRWDREILHAQQEADKAGVQEMPAFDEEEGLFDIESDYERERRTRPMSLSDFRYLVKAFQISGVNIDFRLDADTREVFVSMRGYRNKRQLMFNLDHLPFEMQAQAMLRDAAQRVRYDA